MSDSRGMRSGIAILGILLIATNLRAALTVVGPLVPQVQETTDLSAVAASSLVTIPVLCFAAVSPIAPAISRKIGLERSLALALIVVTTGIVLRSITGGIWAGTVLLGAGVAVLNVLLPALVRRDVPLRISQVTSWYQVTQSVMAGIAAAFAVPVAGVAPGGWRFAFGMTAALAVLSLAVFWPRVMHPAPQRIELTDTGSIPVPGQKSVEDRDRLAGLDFHGTPIDPVLHHHYLVSRARNHAGCLSRAGGFTPGTVPTCRGGRQSRRRRIFCQVTTQPGQTNVGDGPDGARVSSRNAAPARMVTGVDLAGWALGGRIHCDGNLADGTASEESRTDGKTFWNVTGRRLFTRGYCPDCVRSLL